MFFSSSLTITCWIKSQSWLAVRWVTGRVERQIKPLSLSVLFCNMKVRRFMGYFYPSDSTSEVKVSYINVSFLAFTWNTCFIYKSLIRVFESDPGYHLRYSNHINLTVSKAGKYCRVVSSHDCCRGGLIRWAKVMQIRQTALLDKSRVGQ